MLISAILLGMYCQATAAAPKALKYEGVLIPQPQKAKITTEVFALTPSTVISCDQDNQANAKYLQSELERLYHVKCIITPTKVGTNSIRCELSSSIKQQAKGNKEAYELNVGSNGAEIRASDTLGVFYGIQTLKQLIFRNPELSIQGAAITDAPAMAWRGIYLNLRTINNKPETIQSLKNLMNTFAGLKMNTLFIEMPDMIIYDRQKFPATASTALSKAQAADLVNYAKSLHFEVIPAIQMLSHCVWIMSNPQNAELLEDPGHDWGWSTAWCPSHPRINGFIKDMLEETIEVFKPRYLHICMDEINYGAYAQCDRCKTRNPSEMLYQHIMYMHDILADHGVKTVMWHDTLLPAGQYMTGTTDKARGWEIIDKLPKDIVMVDWDYEIYTKESEKRLRYFTQKGFPVLGASFYSPKAIKGFASALAKEPGTMGLFDTLWSYAGSWAQPETIASEAWASSLLTASYAWNPNGPKLENIKYDPVYQISNMHSPSDDIGNWKPVDITRSFNYKVDNTSASWPQYGEGNTLDGAFIGDIRCGQVTFKTAKAADARNAIVLSAEPTDKLPKAPVNITINNKVRRLALLTACNVPLNKDSLADWSQITSHPLVAECTIHYSDGTQVTHDLNYRWNISDWNYKYGGFAARVAWSGKTASGSRIQLLRSDWTNPHPDKTINHITVESQNQAGMSLAIFAVSADCLQEK